MGQTASIGKCNFCGQAFSKSGMTRHLATCKARRTAIEQNGQKSQPIFHVVIWGEHNPTYWMHLELEGRTTLSDFDQFLRDVWVECCGHLSMFVAGNQKYTSIPIDDIADDTMDVRIKTVFKPGMTFRYDYDFGSTTELSGKVVEVREGIWTKRDSIDLMARNDPPRYLCENCEQRLATQICTFCYPPDKSWFCDTCAQQEHSHHQDYMLPVVNSPRVGVCGYTGEPAY
jgi:hypothetical protein